MKKILLLLLAVLFFTSSATANSLIFDGCDYMWNSENCRQIALDENVLLNDRKAIIEGFSLSNNFVPDYNKILVWNTKASLEVSASDVNLQSSEILQSYWIKIVDFERKILENDSNNEILAPNGK
ncbi:MAG: hypothetical protein Q7K42_04535, partial [Candidatus Diapherotrites archaeon]|nr:hypothetical protein [Candidatus Diapherotrites archaeon]